MAQQKATATTKTISTKKVTVTGTKSEAKVPVKAVRTKRTKAVAAPVIDTDLIMAEIAAENEDEAVSVVRQTMNYDKFIPNKFNRNLNQSIIRELDKSFKKNGNLGIPIIVDANYHILDGHHRLAYMKKNKLPVFYSINHAISAKKKEECNTKLICAINNARRDWKRMDYIESYAKQEEVNKTGEYIDYLKLRELIKEYSWLPATSVISTCLYGDFSNSGSAASGNVKSNIVSGEFKIKDYEKTVNILNWLESTFEMFNKDNKKHFSCYVNGKLCRAITYLIAQPEVSKAALIKNINAHWKELVIPSGTHVVDVIDSLCKLYNIKKKQNNRIYMRDRFLSSSSK